MKKKLSNSFDDREEKAKQIYTEKASVDPLQRLPLGLVWVTLQSFFQCIFYISNINVHLDSLGSMVHILPTLKVSDFCVMHLRMG